MPDPMEAYRRRGAHWTFNGERFLQEVAEARKKSWGRFPGFDHAVGDPVENAIQVQQAKSPPPPPALFLLTLSTPEIF